MKYLITAALSLLIHFCFAQNNTWTTRQDFPGATRYLGTSFAVGTKIYFGTGLNQATFAGLDDMWEYDAVGNSWTTRSAFEGGPRLGAISFTINGKGYVGLGGTLGGASFNDLWEYDAATDDWTKKADLPAAGRAGSFVFVINNRAYIGAGENASSATMNDLWEYDPATNTWTSKTALPSDKRMYAAAFSIGAKGYVGTGLNDEDGYLSDFWEYNPATNQWAQKADYPIGNAATISFATATRGYIGLGQTNAFYSYYPNENAWIQEASLPTSPYVNASAAFTNGKLYVGMGFGNGTATNFYQYTPASDQSITFNTLPTKTFGDAAFGLTATSTSALSVSFSSSNTSVATIVGTTVTIVGAGTTDITASQSGNATFDAAGAVVRTLTINKANQTITFNALATKNVTDGPFSLTGTVTSGLTISWSSSNTNVATISGTTVTIVGSGTTTITASQPGNDNYNAAVAVPRDLVVNKLSQSITFGVLSSKTTSDAPFGLTATASSGLSVSYASSNTAVATISGSTVTLVGGGSTTITASQPGNATYSAATSVDQPLTVTKGAQTWIGSLPTTGGYGNKITLTLHLSSSQPYSLTSSNTNVATVAIEGASWVVTPVGLGTTTLTASHPGNVQFNAAPTITADLVVAKGTQTITLADIPTKKIGVDTRFVLVPRASSGLPVTLESNATFSEILISGNTVLLFNSFTGSITAKQAGSDLYEPAQIVKSITVQRGNWSLAMEPIPEMTVGVPPFRPSITIDREVTISSGNPSVATIVGGKVNVVGVGTANIFAVRNQDTHYNSASASQLLTVKAAHTITFDPVANKSVGDPPFDVSATASSGLPVTFASSDPAIATVSGNTVTIIGAGSVLITASAGNATYATTVSTQALRVKNVDQTPSEQGQFWGIQQYGGVHRAGAIYKTNADGTGVTVIKDFKINTEKGGSPYGTLLLTPNGKLYGAAGAGGTYNGGFIYEYDLASGTISKKHELGYADYPLQTLLMAPNGKIYGAKSGSEGSEIGPVIFEIDPATGAFSKAKGLFGTLVSVADIFMSASGKIYALGSSNNQNNLTVVEYNAQSGAIAARGSMSTTSYGVAGMTEAPNGKFYGTTQSGGDNQEGFILEFDPLANTLTQKVSFEKAAFNTTTAQGLMRASNGKLYGIASWGGTYQNGYIYQYNPDANSITKLVLFPKYTGVGTGKLIEAPNGKLYGSGNPGGAGGALFEYNPVTNDLLDLVNLESAPIRSVVGTMVMGSNNKIYGVASRSGANSAGALMEFDYSTLAIKGLVDFDGFSDGANPVGGLTLASTGMLYGITQYGGVTDDGILFKVDPTTNGFLKVADLGGVLGENPRGPLTAGSNGKLYGATITGGARGMGTLFELDPQSNTTRIIVNLFNDGGPGISLYNFMAQASNGLLYATAQLGGDFNIGNNGTLMEVNPSNKSAKALMTFSAANGVNPKNGVMIASNGKVYGTIADGGANNKGVLFEYDISTATYAVKHNFTTDSPATNGPLTELNGKLYGTLQTGGVSNNGVLFEYDIEHATYAVKQDFSFGSMAAGRLLLASNGKLYGTTRSGTPNAILFEYDPATNVIAKKTELPPGYSYSDEINPSLTQTLKSYKLDQTITINPIDGKVLGQPAFTPTATVSSGLSPVFTVGSSNITVTNNSITMQGAGKATLKANQPGNVSYQPAPEAQLVFCINPAKPVISASGANTGTIQLTSSNGSGNQWFKDGAAIPAAKNVALQVTQPGIYSVQSTVEECVSEVSTDFPVIVTGDLDANREIVALYPNPVQDRLYITLPGGNLKRITLLQTDGRVAEEHHTAEALLEIDVRSYSAGLYLVRIADENGTRPTIKFIKK